MSNHTLVVVPIYKRHPDGLEAFSIARTESVLSEWPLAFLAGESLDCEPYLKIAPRAQVIRFPDDYFRSLDDYSRLLTSPAFYNRLGDHEYLLISQPDAFVFDDRIKFWQDQNFDYIGAPYLNSSFDHRARDGRKRKRFVAVGNGGFSLRRVAACARLLAADPRLNIVRYAGFARIVAAEPAIWAGHLAKIVARHQSLAPRMKAFLRRRYEQGEFYEDVFWGMQATCFDPAFRVAPVSIALEFAIEWGLELTIESVYGLRPPFGCHRTHYIQGLQHYTETMQPPEDEFQDHVYKLARRAGLTRPKPQPDVPARRN